ncbi:MAG: hypothetical protein WEB33_05055 [Bacteroidota bacterium]
MRTQSNNKKKKNLGTFLERAKKELMFNKGMTWEEMGDAMQKPGPYERMRDEKPDTGITVE